MKIRAEVRLQVAAQSLGAAGQRSDSVNPGSESRENLSIFVHAPDRLHTKSATKRGWREALTQHRPADFSLHFRSLQKPEAKSCFA
jgi:hypothetical protein